MPGLMDFSDVAILCNRPDNCCQQNLKCFDECLLLSRAAMTVKLNFKNMFFKPQPGLGQQCAIRAFMLLRIVCQRKQDYFLWNIR